MGASLLRGSSHPDLRRACVYGLLKKHYGEARLWQLRGVGSHFLLALEQVVSVRTSQLNLILDIEGFCWRSPSPELLLFMLYCSHSGVGVPGAYESKLSENSLCENLGPGHAPSWRPQTYRRTRNHLARDWCCCDCSEGLEMKRRQLC